MILELVPLGSLGPGSRPFPEGACSGHLCCDERYRRRADSVPKLVVEPIWVALPLPMNAQRPVRSHAIFLASLGVAVSNGHWTERERQPQRRGDGAGPVSVQGPHHSVTNDSGKPCSLATSRSVKKRGGRLSCRRVPLAICFVSSSPPTNSQNVDCAFR